MMSTYLLEGGQFAYGRSALASRVQAIPERRSGRRSIAVRAAISANVLLAIGRAEPGRKPLVERLGQRLRLASCCFNHDFVDLLAPACRRSERYSLLDVRSAHRATDRAAASGRRSAPAFQVDAGTSCAPSCPHDSWPRRGWSICVCSAPLAAKSVVKHLVGRVYSTWRTRIGLRGPAAG